MNTLSAPAFQRLVFSRRLRVLLPAHRSVVLLVPHPDDEVLGCGLLIARLARAGVRLAAIALTEGDGSHPNSRRWPAAALARVRRAEMRRALARLGARAAPLRHTGWHDGQLAMDANVLRVTALCRALGAGLVLATAAQDHHPDHKACFAIGAGVARRLAVPLISYAVWSRLHDAAGQRVRDRHRAAKRWAVAAHRSQVSNYIVDDPDGFRLSEDETARFIAEPERFGDHSQATIRRPARRSGAGNSDAAETGITSI